MKAHFVSTVLYRVVLPGLLAAFLTMGLMVSLPYEVEAYAHLPCRYDPDSIDPITYKFFSVESNVKAAVRSADDEWDDTDAPGYFRRTNSLDPEIEITDYHSSGNWDGRMIGNCPQGGGEWDGNEVDIEFNNRKMDTRTDKQRMLIAEHELGHAYGLDHVWGGCHVMRQGSYKFTCSGPLPSSDDVLGVEARYQ